MSIKSPKQIEWRLSILMAERGIRTATELHRRLTEYGVDISADRISRIVTARPDRLNLDLLAGLATVLECDTGDLLRLVSAGSLPSNTERKPRAAVAPRREKQVATPKQSRVDVPSINDLNSLVAGVLDTKVHPIPVKKRD